MSLPAPAATHTLAYVLLRVRALLQSSALTAELAAQQTALRTQSGNASLTLPAPGLVVIGDPDWAQTAGQLTPGIIIDVPAPSTYAPDVSGDTYHVETPLRVTVVYATADAGAVDEQGMMLVRLAYLHAIGLVLSTHLMGSTWGSLAGVYDCVPTAIDATEPTPVRRDDGWTIRYAASTHLVRWQTYQPAPSQP